MKFSPRPRALLEVVLLAAWCAAAPACSSEILLTGAAAACGDAPCDEDEPACDGTDPESFCDDCNPCTAKANCTPCSTVPRHQRDIYHCTLDDKLPRFCAGRSGCVQVPVTTPPGQMDSCFPVASPGPLHSGSCQIGVCVDDEP